MGGSGQVPLASEPAPSSRFARLNHLQWENTVRDLLRLPERPGLSKAFVAEPLRGTFDNNGGILSVSTDLWSDYQSAAEALAKKVARDPALLAGIAPAGQGDPVARGRAFVETFGLRAFRRPLTDAEVTRYASLFERGATLFATGDPVADGVELVVGAFLQSPHFLYRSETSTEVANGRIRLGDYEIASRLSYGITTSMPDDALLAAAADQRLDSRDGLLEQARRLLRTPAGQQTMAAFHEQLLRMRDYETVKKDEAQAPLFSEGVGEDLKRETLALVEEVIFAQGRGLTELLTASYTFANGRIAKMYGLPVAAAAAEADRFVRVDLDPTERAGYLTQMGFLTTYAEGETPNIIMRGVHVAHDVLCIDLPAPPDAVPPLPTLSPGATNRQRVQELTGAAPCNTCHETSINPLGFAFETLDGFGQHRTRDNGQPVDASSRYTLDGREVSFDGPVELIQAIAASKQAHDCYARRLAEFLYGREVDPETPADKGLVDQAGARSKVGSSVQDLVLELVATEAFTTRLP